MESELNNKFIQKAKKIHGDKYDYSSLNYKNRQTKIMIKCLNHGIFEQTPCSHLSGKGCPYCTGNKKSTLEEFIAKAKKVHGNKYDYSITHYVNNKTKVKIICKEHGEFEQRPDCHITQKQGCFKCGVINGHKKQLHDTNIFIEKSKKIHGDKFDYSKTQYIKDKTMLIITCPKHGDFKQRANNHLNGDGCPTCKSSKGELYIESILIEKNISYVRQHTFYDCKNIKQLPFDFYLPELNMCIEYDGRHHFECIDLWGGEENLNYIKTNDKIKENYCLNNNISLVRISYKDDLRIKLINEITKINKKICNNLIQ
jgi:hypothetical protein